MISKRSHRIVNRAGVRPMPRPLAGPDRAATPVVRGDESWYRISNAGGRGGTAEVYIYDEIGYWGVSAQRFVDELRELDADAIDLHINSPGGEVYDGIAIYNALLNHPAQINVTVDALAASAASFIAQAGHSVTMAANAEMMIHDAIGIAWDNAAGLRELAERLDAVSDNIAAIYSARAGGTVTAWRKTMQAETWYSAREAVDAGLADTVVAVQRRGADGETDNRWSSRRDAISARFRYVNRGATATPVVPIVGERGPEMVAPPAEAVTVDIQSLFPDALEFYESAAGLRDALHIGAGMAEFNLSPDTFRTAIEMAANNAPAPPAVTRRPVGPGPLTRTVGTGAEGVNLNDVMREAVTG